MPLYISNIDVDSSGNIYAVMWDFDEANVITLGARLISKNNAFKYISVFLNTKFEGGRHLRRIKKI